MATAFASASPATATKRPSSTPEASTGSLKSTATPGASGGTPSPCGATETTRGAGSGATGPQAARAAATSRACVLPHGVLLPENSPPVSSSSSAVISSTWFSLSARSAGVAGRIERQLHEQPAALEVEPGGPAHPLLPPIDEARGGPGRRRLVPGEDELVEVPAQADAELGGGVDAKVVGLDRSGDAHHPGVALGPARLEGDARQPVCAARTGHPGPQAVGGDAVVVGRRPLHLPDGGIAGGDQHEHPVGLGPGRCRRLGGRWAGRRPAGRREGRRGAGARARTGARCAPAPEIGPGLVPPRGMDHAVDRRAAARTPASATSPAPPPRPVTSPAACAPSRRRAVPRGPPPPRC